MIHFPKSKKVPESLKNKRSYRGEDVLDALRKDFHNKCYICEDKELTTLNIEHFKPHKGDESLKYDWNNLYLACSHCNNTKLAKPEYDNILNCTDLNDDPENWIEYDIPPFPKEKVKLKAIKIDDKVLNTVQLLNLVYNGETPIKKLESSNLRTKLIKEITEFQKYLQEYYFEDLSEDEMRICKNKIQRHLKSSSAFTAFKRWIVKRNKDIQKEFTY